MRERCTLSLQSADRNKWESRGEMRARRARRWPVRGWSGGSAEGHGSSCWALQRRLTLLRGAAAIAQGWILQWEERAVL